MRHRLLAGLCVCVAFAGILPALGASDALAASPGQLAIQGALRTTGGGVIADGKYGLTIALYGDAKGAAVHSEVFVAVPVTAGAFALTLGQNKPIAAKVLASATAPHVGVTVDNDPELPRVPLSSVAYALVAAAADDLLCSGCITSGHLTAGAVSGQQVSFTYAGSKIKGGAADKALDLTCTGCVSVSELAFDADVELGTHKLSAARLEAKEVVATTVTAAGFVGDGSKLTGIKAVTGACEKAGEVVKGVEVDGSLICVPSMDEASLPPGGLNEVSGGMLTTQFVDVLPSAAAVAIPDNNPTGVTSTIVVPTLGVAESIGVEVDITTSTTASLTVRLYDPKNVEYTLFEKAGSGKALKAKWPPEKLVKGDLDTWLGKDAGGTWRLQVIDTGATSGGNDGEVKSWALHIGSRSSKKVAAVGLLQANGGFQFQVAGTHPVGCDAARFGYAYANPKTNTLNVCNGKEFHGISLLAVGTASSPGKSCNDILTKLPLSKSGLYWVALGGAARQVYCNMEDFDGGWTLAARMVTGSWCHIDANDVGTVKDPTQTACAKLSDASIRELYGDQFWLTCGTVTPHRFGKIDNIANFDTTAKSGNKKMTWAATYKGATYSGGDDSCCNFGDHPYHNPHIIYSIAPTYNGGNYKADGNWSGCYNSVGGGWKQSGMLWVR